MANFGELLRGLASLLWPVLIAVAGYRYRNDIASLFQVIRRQISSGAALKWKDFEFRGIDVSAFENRLGSPYNRIAADEEILQRRDASYAKNKNLFLVHRTRPTGRMHAVVGLPTYDMSIYLVSHKNFGRLNDVREVQYYFGKHFGQSISEFGTKYVVSNGTDGFAIKINAYGPTLCEAVIVFHDGSETTVSRYLDFEGTGYKFDLATNASDAEKLRVRGEEP